MFVVDDWFQISISPCHWDAHPIAPLATTGTGFRKNGVVSLEGSLSILQRLRMGWGLLIVSPVWRLILLISKIAGGVNVKSVLSLCRELFLANT